MSLNPEEVEKIAHLARLAITADELPIYVKSLSSIVEFVEQLKNADTKAVVPMAHPLVGQSQRLRRDEITEVDRHEQYQSIAPAVQAGLYLVPKVIE
jgi:aspartyl-tRNA(Asn)/glutamyl-tRNA(Gln) amidotransferase subunit C